MTDPHPQTPPPVALVTGANRGIGRAVAGRLARLGLSVLVAARDRTAGEAAAAELRANGGDAHPITLDVTDPDAADAAAAEIADRFGRLDVLVNNAGISGALERQLVATADLATVREVFETNVFGVIRVTNAMLPLLRRSPAGRIVNVSSEVGSLALAAEPDGYFARLPGSAAYVPSKAALNALTLQYAKDLRDTGIRVNSVTPGACATDFTKQLDFPITRTADDGAAVIVGLATAGADGPTGGFFGEAGDVPW